MGEAVAPIEDRRSLAYILVYKHPLRINFSKICSGTAPQVGKKTTFAPENPLSAIHRHEPQKQAAQIRRSIVFPQCL